MLVNKLTWEEIVNRAAKKVGGGKKFKEWMMGKEEIGYKFDYGLYSYCYRVAKKINNEIKKNDHFTVIIGKEGSGKSTLTSQIAAIVSPDLSINHVCFKATEFIKNMQEGKPGQTIWVDEGSLILLSLEGNSKLGRIINKCLQTVRLRRYHFCVCIPKFSTLNKYVREHRIDNLIWVNETGNYILFDDESVHDIVQQIKRGQKFEKVVIHNRHKWRGYYNKGMPTINDFSEEAYNKLKEESVDDWLSQAMELVEELENENEDNKLNIEHDLIPVSEALKKIPLERSTLIKKIKAKKLEGKKLGNKWFISKESLESWFAGAPDI